MLSQGLLHSTQRHSSRRFEAVLQPTNCPVVPLRLSAAGRTVAVDSEVSVRIRLSGIVFLWLGFVLPSTAAAQTVTVAGTVTDPQGSVVAGASVTLTAANVP